MTITSEELKGASGGPRHCISTPDCPLKLSCYPALNPTKSIHNLFISNGKWTELLVLLKNVEALYQNRTKFQGFHGFSWQMFCYTWQVVPYLLINYMNVFWQEKKLSCQVLYGRNWPKTGLTQCNLNRTVHRSKECRHG